MTRFADGPTVEVAIDIDAPIDVVWDLVTDIDLSAWFQDEFRGAEWLDDGPALEARFVGRNESGSRAWETTSTIVGFDPPRLFRWAVNDVDDPAATWTFRLDERVGGTGLTYHRVVGPGPSGLTAAIERYPHREEEIIASRDEQHRRHMRALIEGVKAIADGA